MLTAVFAPIAVVAVLILLNGLFVAAEFAIVGSRPSRIEHEGDGGWAPRYLRRILEDASGQDRYIAIAQVGITLATIGLGMYGEPSVASWLYGPLERLPGVGTTLAHTIGTVLAVGGLTYLHVVIGEMIPKAMALQAPERTALSVAWPMRLAGLVFLPLVAVLNGIATLLLRALRVPIVHGESRLYTPEELVYLVRESHRRGAVSESEQELIANIVDFGDRRVRDLMVPRTRVEGIPLDEDLALIEERMNTLPFSRYPVYRDDLDHVVGIVHVKDVIRQQAKDEPFDLRTLVRRVPRVPESMPAERLLAAYQRLHVHMAVVVDEYGGTSGIVTLDDLIGEIVGEVEDEFSATEGPELEALGEGRYRVDGAMSLHDLNEELDLELASEAADTIAGLALEELQRAPEADDEVEVAGLRLRVTEVDGLAIRALEMQVLPATREAHASGEG